MAAAPATVRLRSADGRWVVLGAEESRGIVPEGVSLTANEQGSDSCSFTLRRRTRTAWPDLAAFNQCEIEVAGARVWSGRVWQTPTTDDESISVQGRGWQYHLDDRLILRFYVQTDMTAYSDARSHPSTNLGNNRSAPGVQVGSGQMVLTWPAGFTVAVSDFAGALLDTGQSGIGRVVVTWERVGASDANNTLYSRASGSADNTTAADDGSAVMTSASGTISHTTTTRRYHHLFLFRNGSAGAIGADQGVKVTAVKLFGSTAWESGGASILKASDVVTNMLGAALPLLSASTARIGATSFSIPDFQSDGYRSPRELITAANAYHDWLWGVDVDRQVYFRARPSVPAYELGAWSGAPFSDTSSNDADGLYNEVIVQYTGPDGQQANEVRTATSGLLTAQGFTRSKVLAIESAITQAAAQQIGDAWLARRTAVPLRGGVAVYRGSVRQTSGAPVHPAHLLLGVGERLRLTDRVDPATGAWGRDGTIVQVSYDHDSESASVAIDDTNDRLQALLARYGVQAGQVRS